MELHGLFEIKWWIDTNSRGIATRRRMVGPGRLLHSRTCGAMIGMNWVRAMVDVCGHESSVGDEHGSFALAQHVLSIAGIPLGTSSK